MLANRDVRTAENLMMTDSQLPMELCRNYSVTVPWLNMKVSAVEPENNFPRSITRCPHWWPFPNLLHRAEMMNNQKYCV